MNGVEDEAGEKGVRFEDEEMDKEGVSKEKVSGETNEKEETTVGTDGIDI